MARRSGSDAIDGWRRRTAAGGSELAGLRPNSGPGSVLDAVWTGSKRVCWGMHLGALGGELAAGQGRATLRGGGGASASDPARRRAREGKRKGAWRCSSYGGALGMRGHRGEVAEQRVDDGPELELINGGGR